MFVCATQSNLHEDGDTVETNDTSSGGGLVKRAMFGCALFANVQLLSLFSVLPSPACIVRSFGVSSL